MAPVEVMENLITSMIWMKKSDIQREKIIN